MQTCRKGNLLKHSTKSCIKKFFFSSALKTQFQPPPVPFLYRNSSVNDFYGGDIATPFTSVLSSDVSLVMYYAPWDFDSQLTRKVFDDLASKYKSQVCHSNKVHLHQELPRYRWFHYRCTFHLLTAGFKMVLASKYFQS